MRAENPLCSIFVAASPSLLLKVAARFLGIHPPALGPPGRLGRTPRLLRNERFCDKFTHPLTGLVEVAFLRPLGASPDHERLILSDQAALQLGPQLRLVIIREGQAGPDGEPKLDGRLDLIDVLAARPARAHGSNRQLRRWDRQPTIDEDVAHETEPLEDDSSPVPEAFSEMRRRFGQVKIPVRWPSLNTMASA